MKEAYGGTWLFQLVIVFVLLFTGYMCLSINYTRAFDVKDKIINEIERNGGFRTTSKDNALSAIVEYMQKVGYRATGTCDNFKDTKNPKKSVGCTRNGKCEEIATGKQYAFCVKEVSYDSEGEDGKLYGKHVVESNNGVEGEFLYLSYYRIRVFYKLDLPIIGRMFNFNINGDTKTLYRTQNKK